jgi:hypothetical protein
MNKASHRTAHINPHYFVYKTPASGGRSHHTGSRAVNARGIREDIAESNRAYHEVRAWLVSKELDPQRWGTAYDVEYSVKRDGTLAIDVLRILPGASAWEDERCDAAWSLSHDVDTIVYADGSYA